uniref:NADH-ubiquinone oxidoreductase chain 4 n=1 Tax=Laevapex fuscus TaxID=240816 RepID=A0A8F8FFQ1_9GAST|nr:NADH dehydrogenase subunit 4 [Laevapex fuscus]
MLSMLFGMVSLLFIYNWGYMISSMMLMIFLSLFLFNQNFVWSMNMIFSSSNVSMLMIFLSIMLCFLAFISTPDNKKPKYLFCITFLMMVLFLAFSMENYILFYIFFEASLIPTLFLVVFWGYQPERLQAGSYMMLYTVSASLPLLVTLVYLFMKENSMMIMLVSTTDYYYLTIIIYLAFLVKLPMFTLHFWLPKAHVEASLAGSMILAGILLKLGGYGLIQMNKIFNLSGDKNIFLIMILSVSVWGAFLASISCLRQTDMKSYVAYSSVAHMSLVIVGILNDQYWGIISALVTMFAHAFSSSALFCLTYFTYKKVNSRNMLYMKGMLMVFPMISFFWFLFCSINMAAPPTLNLLGEMFVVPAMFSISYVFLFMMGILIFFSALYNMYLYSLINHGKFSSYIVQSIPMQSYQFSSLLFHSIPLILVFNMKIFS